VDMHVHFSAMGGAGGAAPAKCSLHAAPHL
jgi:hypothetical protein